MTREWTSPDGRMRLINGDCMDFMRGCKDGEFSLAVCDPPYGGNDAIGMKDCKQESKQATGRNQYKAFDNTAPTQAYFDELKRACVHQIIWGVNFYQASGLDGGRICWDKKGTAFGRGELAYYSGSKSVEVFEYAWNGMIQGDMKNKEARIHSCQKPVALYRWLFQNYAKPGDRILDTHVGSASSFIAAWEKGFEITGCELDADYFDAAVARIEKAMQQPALPFATLTPPQPHPTVQELF